jgi:CRP/FNR family transcriptional regulator, cyclic AMP receptor protein
LSRLEQDVELFAIVPLFKGLEPDEVKSLTNTSKRVEFKAGDYIVREGESGLGFYVIANGQAAVKRKGKEVAKLRRGDFFGEMSLLDDQPRSADVVAEAPTTCLVLLRWNFWALVSKNKKIARSLLEEMAKRLRAANEALTN